MCPKRLNQRRVEWLIEKSYTLSVSYKHGPNQDTVPAIGATTLWDPQDRSPTFEDEGTKGFWSPKFCEQQGSNKVEFHSKFTKFIWITYGRNLRLQ